MPVRILEVASITAPKGVVRWFYDDCTRPLGLGHDLVDFDFGGHVVPNGTLGRAWVPKRESCIMRNARSRPQREFQTRLQVKEHDLER
jgi:hypothetical protein